MNSLKQILEGILDANNRHNVGNSVKNLCPVPSSRDFKKNYFGASYVEWPCAPLIELYLDEWDNTNAVQLIKSFGFTGLYGSIDTDKVVHIYIYTPREKFPILGIGGWEGGMVNAKKSIINFFKRVQNNPEIMKKVFDIANKSNAKGRQYGMYDYTYLDNIK